MLLTRLIRIASPSINFATASSSLGRTRLTSTAITSLLHEFLIQAMVRVNAVLPDEALAHALASRESHANGALGIVEQRGHGSGEGVGVVRVDEQTGDAVFDQLAETADSRRDDRPPHCRGLETGERE